MTIIKQSLGFRRITGNFQLDRGNRLTLTSVSEYSPINSTESFARWNGPKSGSVGVSSNFEIRNGYQNTTRVISNNVIGTIIAAPAATNNPATIQFFTIGGGGGGGNPRGFGPGGAGGGGGYVYANISLGPGNYPITAGGGGSAGACSNQSGTGGGQSSAFGYTAGSGGGGMSEHNGNCNGCWPGGPTSSSFGTHTNGSGGGCNYGANAGTNPISLDITGTLFDYGAQDSVGGRTYGQGQPGTTIIRFTNSSFIGIITS